MEITSVIILATESCNLSLDEAGERLLETVALTAINTEKESPRALGHEDFFAAGGFNPAKRQRGL